MARYRSGFRRIPIRASFAPPRPRGGVPASRFVPGLHRAAAEGPDRGIFRFSSESYSVAEADGTATVTVLRSGGAAGAASVTLSATGGTATAGGTDYSAELPAVLEFAGGQESRTLAIAITPDASEEGDETVTLALSGPTGGATLGSPSAATLTIVDDDAPAPDPTGEISLSAWEVGTPPLASASARLDATTPSSLSGPPLVGSAGAAGSREPYLVAICAEVDEVREGARLYCETGVGRRAEGLMHADGSLTYGDVDDLGNRHGGTTGAGFVQAGQVGWFLIGLGDDGVMRAIGPNGAHATAAADLGAITVNRGSIGCTSVPGTGAAALDGAGLLRGPTAHPWGASGVFSFAGWVRFPAAVPTGTGNFAAKRFSAGQYSWWVRWQGSTGRFQFHASDNGASLTQANSAAVSPSANGWYFVCGGHDGTTLSLKVYGQANSWASPFASATASLASPVYEGTAPLCLGAFEPSAGAGTASEGWSGRLDEWSVWAKAPDDSMFQGLFNLGDGVAVADHAGSQLTSRVAAWSLDETAGDREDSQGTNDLTPVGAVVVGSGVLDAEPSAVGLPGRVQSLVAAVGAGAGLDQDEYDWLANSGAGRGRAAIQARYGALGATLSYVPCDEPDNIARTHGAVLDLYAASGTVTRDEPLHLGDLRHAVHGDRVLGLGDAGSRVSAAWATAPTLDGKRLAVEMVRDSAGFTRTGSPLPGATSWRVRMAGHFQPGPLHVVRTSSGWVYELGMDADTFPYLSITEPDATEHRLDATGTLYGSRKVSSLTSEDLTIDTDAGTYRTFYTLEFAAVEAGVTVPSGQAQPFARGDFVRLLDAGLAEDYYRVHNVSDTHLYFYGPTGETVSLGANARVIGAGMVKSLSDQPAGRDDWFPRRRAVSFEKDGTTLRIRCGRTIAGEVDIPGLPDGPSEEAATAEAGILRDPASAGASATGSTLDAVDVAASLGTEAEWDAWAAYHTVYFHNGRDVYGDTSILADTRDCEAIVDRSRWGQHTILHVFLDEDGSDLSDWVHPQTGGGESRMAGVVTSHPLESGRSGTYHLVILPPELNLDNTTNTSRDLLYHGEYPIRSTAIADAPMGRTLHLAASGGDDASASASAAAPLATLAEALARGGPFTEVLVADGAATTRVSFSGAAALGPMRVRAEGGGGARPTATHAGPAIYCAGTDCIASGLAGVNSAATGHAIDWAGTACARSGAVDCTFSGGHGFLNQATSNQGARAVIAARCHYSATSGGGVAYYHILLNAIEHAAITRYSSPVATPGESHAMRCHQAARFHVWHLSLTDTQDLGNDDAGFRWEALGCSVGNCWLGQAKVVGVTTLAAADSVTYGYDKLLGSHDLGWTLMRGLHSLTIGSAGSSQYAQCASYDAPTITPAPPTDPRQHGAESMTFSGCIRTNPSASWSVTDQLGTVELSRTDGPYANARRLSTLGAPPAPTFLHAGGGLVVAHVAHGAFTSWPRYTWVRDGVELPGTALQYLVDLSPGSEYRVDVEDVYQSTNSPALGTAAGTAATVPE